MSAYAVPFAIPKQPRSLLQPTRRDFATTAGDDFTIEITVYPTDTDTSAYNVTGATSEFVVYDDSSREVLTVVGAVSDGAAGRIDIDVDGDDTTELAGRYSFRVTVEFADGTSTVTHGAVHIASRAGTEMISGSGSLPSSTVLDLTEVTIQTATITTAEIGALTVTGGFVGEGTGSFGGNLSVTGNITATGDISAGDDMAVTGDATIGGTLTVTGNVTTGDVTAGEVDLTAVRISTTHDAEGATDPDTSPFSMQIQLPRVTGVTAPTGNREIMPLRIQSDNILTETSAGGYGTVRHWSLLSRLGTAGKAAADSWAGARVAFTIGLQEKSQPVEAVAPRNPSRSQPATNALWLSQFHSVNRGGTGLARAFCRGSTFNLYSIMVLQGATFLNVTRQMELGFQMESTGSTRAYRVIAAPIIKVDGPIPPGPFTVVGATRNRLATPGYVSGFLAGGRQGVGGMDPFNGIAFEHSASSADVRPQALAGLSIREVKYLRNAIEWAGGDIGGGTLGAAGTGRLRLGTAFFETTSSGLSLDVCGYEGSAAGSIISLSSGDTVIYPELGTFLEDEHEGNGVYRARARYPTKIGNVEVVLPPVSKTNPGSAKTQIEIKPHTQTTPVYSFNVTSTATTTTHPAPILNTTDDFCVGMYLEYMSGVCAGERQIITDYNATTGVITTAAFSAVPTTTNDAITNGNFTTNPTTGAEGVITAGWSWFADGTAPQPSWVSHQVYIAGDGTNAAGIDQQVTVVALTDYILGFTFKGSESFTVKLGTAQGDSDVHETVIDPDLTDEDDVTTPQVAQVRFSVPSGTSVWLRIQNTGAGEAIIDRVTCQAVTDADSIYGVRAKIVTPTLELAHTWTQKNTLALQGSGGPMTVGGTADIAGNFSVATSKFTVAASTGNTAVAGTLGVTGATTVAALTTSGDVIVGSSKVTVAAASGNTAIAGTLAVTGATTAAAVTTSGDVTVGSSKVTIAAATGNTAIAGTLAVTGATTAAAVTASGTVTGATFVPSSASAPTNGLYLPAANTLGLSVNSAAEVQLTSSALSPAANDGNALGTSSLSWSDLFLASGGVVNWNNGTVTLTETSGVLALTATSLEIAGGLGVSSSFAINTNKFSVVGSSGNTSIAGTLSVTGATSVTSTITANSSGTTLASLQGTMIYAGAADGSPTRVTIDAAANDPSVQFRRYDGTYASPSAVASAAGLGRIAWRGYTGSAMSGERGYIEAVAAEAWSTSANGVHIDFGTTTTGSVSLASRRMRLTAAGQLLIGTTTASAELTVTGNVWWSGYSLASVGNALTATGTTRTDALQLAKQYNRLTTVASGTGVILPTGVVGMAIVLFNAGANVCKVYANGSETIDGTAGSTGVNLTNGNRCVYMFMASNTWISAQMGAVSA